MAPGLALLVIGAAGIFAPLVRDRARAGTPVLAVGRRADALAALADEPGVEGRVATLALDTSAPEAGDLLSAHGPFGAAVVYGPATDPVTRPGLLGAVEGPALLVLTSGAADPASGSEGDCPSYERTIALAGPGGARVGEDFGAGVGFPALADTHRPRPGDGVLLLGWEPQARRWHTAAEVSGAVSEWLETGADAILGVLAPWSERPR